MSGGVVKATPHCVMVKPMGDGTSRNSFAVFMGPSGNESMAPPLGSKYENIVTADPTGEVPTLEKRWKPEYTFAEFEKATFESYYNY